MADTLMTTQGIYANTHTIESKVALTMDELISRFKLSNVADGKSEKTIEWYDDILRLSLRYLETKYPRPDLSHFNADNARAYILYLRARKKFEGHPHTLVRSDGLSPRTIQDHVREQVLSQLEKRCLVMMSSLDRFDKYVSSYAVMRLIEKLSLLGAWVSMRAEALNREHRGEGYVCVFVSEAVGMNAYWVERKELVADKARWRSSGWEVLSVDEAKAVLEGIVKELDAGNWTTVVNWLARYGKSPGLDFDRFIRDGQ
jgi:hypothetical protein